jgi:tellurite resistance protein TerC
MGPHQTPLIVATSIGMWVGFVVVVLLLILVVFRRTPHEIRPREAAVSVGMYVGLAVLFGIGLLVFETRAAALTFATGYVLEESLSIDNIFVMVLIFNAFSVPKAYQHRVLFYGILGAMVMRGAFIGVGLALVGRFGWVMYLFGAMLVYAGARTAFAGRDRVDPERNPVVRFVQRFVPLTSQYEGERFIVSRNARWMATPLLLVLVLVEATDVLFATDSIPAIFGITRDPFLVFTSNILAVLGLRSLYFLVASAIDRLALLKYGLGAILVFAGLKMLAQPYIQVGTGTSLAVILGILLVSSVASLMHAR